jgi:hypothetical protein
MGNRGHIKIEQSGDRDPVVLYSHWGADRLPQQLTSALEQEARWGDPEYLARIIFDKMTEDASRDHTGYGIGTSVHGDAWRVISVDCEEQTVTFEEGHGYGSGDTRGGEKHRFEEYVKLHSFTS